MSSPVAPLAAEVLSVLRTVAVAQRVAPPATAPLAAATAPSPAAQRLVREHLLGPLAAHAGLTTFRHDAVANALLWEARRAQWREVVARLARHGIAAAPIKGMAYALEVYDEPALRPMSDIDVLVPADAFVAATAVLRDAGFTHSGGAHQLAPTHHAMTFKRVVDGGGGVGRGLAVAIDLHRHIVHAERTGLRAEAWWARARDRGVDGWQLAPLDALLLHIAHMARHEFQVPLVNVLDGALLARHWQMHGDAHGDQFASWAALREHAARARMARLYSVWQHLTVTALGLGPAVPPVRRSLLARYCSPDVEDLAVAHRPTRARQVGQKLALCQGPAEALGLMRSAVVSAKLRRFDRDAG